MHARVRRFCGAITALALLAGDLSATGRHLLRLPGAVTVAVGQPQSIVLDAPGPLGVRLGPAPGPLGVDGRDLTARRRVVSGGTLRLLPTVAGSYTLRLDLFGVLPWRSVRIDAVRAPELVPGGQAVGVVLRSRGPLVVALRPVPGPGGTALSPAAAGGMRPGDVVLAVDGRATPTAQAIADALEAVPAGKAAEITVLRAQRPLQLRVLPVRSAPGAPALIGAWVRQSTGGIGTLTFTAANGTFGALGHPVVDPTTGTAIVLGRGSMVPSLISGMQPSRDGRPGEKIGALIGGVPALGQVTANTAYGVFGSLQRQPTAGPWRLPVPVDLPDQVHPGPAQLLTVVDGRTVGVFAARIVSVLAQRTATTRGFVVAVTDPRLLASSGGIVQGMSGSPVLQDGRLVGAITHVFVDDPARGYGVLAVWMAQRAGLWSPAGEAGPAGAV